MDEPVTFATILVAFPEREADRAFLREFITGNESLPARYADAVILPCGGCSMPLNVGPRSARTLGPVAAMVLRCPLCAAKMLDDEQDLTLINLRNPASRPARARS
jgi:hypothetical protein